MNDALSGVAGGIVGTTAMTLVLFVFSPLFQFDVLPFEALAELVGAPERVLAGFVLFFGVGALVWPLLFVSFNEFLPGDTDAVKGAVFAIVLWISFSLVFASRTATVGGLLLQLAITLVAHLVYGFSLGRVYAVFADRTTHAV